MPKIPIGQNAKVNIKWRVRPIEHDEATEKEIIAVFAKKYGIPKGNITIEPKFITKNGSTDIGDESPLIIGDIQDVAFQQKLFKSYLEETGTENYDFDKLIEIDNEINDLVNYETYSKKRKYNIKWIKWSNFMSYGPNNFFDFTQLSGLVLLSSKPANQGGKTTFSIDLLRYLLYGKTDSRGPWTKNTPFNIFLKDNNDVSVEGCICIDGEDYIIKRTLTRSPNGKKDSSSVTNKVSFFKVVGDNYVNMIESGEDMGEDTITATNKAIKEYVGDDYDFSLMISIDQSNLTGLITQTDGERGKLVKRWVGLKPLKDKLDKAREVHNAISKKLLKNTYDRHEVEEKIKQLTADNVTLTTEMKSLGSKIKALQKDLEGENKRKEDLLSAKIAIDENLVKTDVQTVEAEMEKLKEEGKKKGEELEKLQNEFKEIKDITFDAEELKKADEAYMKANNEVVKLRSEVKSLNETTEQLKVGQFCPTCHTKLKDNSELIKANEEKAAEIIKKGKTAGKKADDLKAKKEALEAKKTKYEEKVKLQLKIDAVTAGIESKRSQWKELKAFLASINANKDAIKKNNDIQAKVNVINETIKTTEKSIHEMMEKGTADRLNVENNKREIEKSETIVKNLLKEEESEANWRVYLDMLDDKKGVSKMVLKKVLPLINNELRCLMQDVCDFTLEVDIDAKDNVTFYMLCDGERLNLTQGSGLEQTAASLALRAVLGKISTFTKPSFVVFDEILGSVADENYDNLKKLYDKIVKDYAFVLQITHLKALYEWHDKVIQITKENHISKIELL